nr:autotransporter outer membrane beta-barrel domain-containing protein [Sphingobium sp.]
MSLEGGAPWGRRVRVRALQTSAIFGALLVAGPVYAQCSPDPTTANGATNCTGTDSDGLIVATSGTQVIVAADGVVRPGGSAAAIVNRATNTSFDIRGLVDGGAGKAGLFVTTGPAISVPCDPYAGATPYYCVPGSTVTSYPSVSTSITMAQGGTVTGAQGILIRRDAGNSNGIIYATISNRGTISGTAGPAIVADQMGFGTLSVYNYAPGLIGGMSGSLSYVSNLGTIDGGSNAAIASTASYLNIHNSGTIRSNGSAATISGTSYASISNATGATIGGSATAIRMAESLSLTNQGTINGSVIVTTTGRQSSTIDTRTGTINGDLLLGSGDDTLQARYDATSGRISSITGRIDGGTGTDTVELGVDSDMTFRTVVLPSNFERFGLLLSNNATATLAADFTPTTSVRFGGTGTLVNEAALVTAGPAITSDFLSFGLTFDNRNSITATLSGNGSYAVSNPTTVINSGIITANGGSGVSANSNLTNSGTIVASGAGAAVSYGNIDNSGTIRSTGGTGVTVGYSNAAVNSGTIDGATTGLSLTLGRLTNSGAISGGTNGVVLGGTLINTATGTITGGVSGGGYSSVLANAGRIAGGVNLTSPYFYDFNSDIFVDNGGSVTGAILLGGGDDQLIVDLDAPSGRALAGAAGGVDAGAGWDTLRYRVKADANATMALVNGFEALAYELSNNAALTLTTTSPLSTTLGLAGNGTVTLIGDLSTSDRTLVDATTPTTDQLTGGGAGPDRALTIVNNGTLSLSKTAQNYNYGTAAIVAGTADITNNGTISVTNASGIYYPASAIFGGTAVTNTGTISLNGNGVAITDAKDVVNSGVITDVAGSRASGVTSFTTLTNRGTIEVDGLAVDAVDAVYYRQAQVTNSGTIASRTGAAVRLSYYGTLTNEAGGTIRGATAIDLSNGGMVINRGAIMGDVAALPYSYSSAAFVADGGTLEGNLTFGQGRDLFVQTGDTTGVSGTIDAGAGFDIYGQSRSSSHTIDLSSRAGINFEADYVQALGDDTVLTLTAADAIANNVYVQGDGTIVNDATIDGAVSTFLPVYTTGLITGNRLAAFVNRGTIGGGVSGTIASFSNSGAIGSGMLDAIAVQIQAYENALAFDNSGSIASSGQSRAVMLTGYDLTGLSMTNSGTIEGGMGISATFAAADTPAMMTIDNNGSISNAMGSGLVVTSRDYFPSPDNPVAVSLHNSGTIESSAASGAGVTLNLANLTSASYAIDNQGVIRASGGGSTGSYGYYSYPDYTYTEASYTDPAVGLLVYGNGAGVSGTISNAGTIEATGEKSVALIVSGSALDLSNSGTIRGQGDTLLAADDLLAAAIGTTTLAGAIQVIGTADDRIVNTGSIIGSIDLGAGNDRIDNYGRIEGNVWLGAGDDIFLHAADAVLTGIVDAGLGDDSLIIDATRGGAVNGDQFVNFERFSQIGNGAVAYSGSFNFDSIGLMGGTVTVAAGHTLSSSGPTTIKGGGGAETVLNDGTITGTVDLGAGNDRVVNNGRIGGAVLLGAGDDQFVERPGSSVAGIVDGGAGNDLYTVMLAGDRSGIGQRTGFERLSAEGNGTLALTLDQNFQTVALNGTGLALALNGFAVGGVMGSGGAESFSVDGDVAAAMMGAGDDVLALATTQAAGVYNGGAGNDLLRFTANAPATLAGTVTGFEQIGPTGGALDVWGTLGAASDSIGFGDGAQSLTIALGGTLAGTIDLGAGNDSFRLAAGATMAGAVSGGAGTDSATLELAGDRTLGTGLLTGFEILNSEGTGTLTLTGAHVYVAVNAGTNLSVASGASLSAPVIFGAGDNRFTIAGGFAGSVDGGAGTDTIQISGGSSAAPVAFTNVADVEALGMSAGFATLSGTGSFGSIDLTGGRLVGLAGSVIRAGQIAVRQGATFGSAGVVNGNITVAGTLSPGASPGTMTVNGNVALASGSISLFEITPTIADQLIVNGTLTIANGASLKIVADGQMRPGTSYDLIIASGGITGSYTTIDKADTLFGFIVQRADRIQLLGRFLNDPLFNPQVSRSVDYANSIIPTQAANSPLFAALPLLLLANGGSNPAAFARLTPEPYASATQLGVDQALTLADAARGPGFAFTDSDDVHAFTFGQVLGQWHRMAGDRKAGTSSARARGYGLLGGVGVGNRDWAVGGFIGYLDSRQRIDALGASTKTDGFVAGVHGRYAAGGLRLSTSILYD